MTALVFLDTETTSLRHDRRAWDIALLHRDGDGDETVLQWFVQGEDLDLGNADPFALRIGRFYDRHPGPSGLFAPGADPERWVLEQVEVVTRGAHIVGCVPNFDTEVLATRMRAHGILPSWHYHLIDVEALAIGCLAERREAYPHSAAADVFLTLPWKSDDLSRALGVDPPSDEDRHTAIGDARWARDLYDAVMGKAATDGQ